MGSMVFVVIAIIAIGLFFLVGMILRGGRGHNFDVEEYQTRWLKIENGLLKNQPQSYPVAVMNADKLLDRAMQELTSSGKTMGERLKTLDQRFSDVNKVWFAHKVRNQIAHDSDYELSYDTASRALSAFKQALKDLGAI